MAKAAGNDTKRGRGRPAGFTMTEEHRDKIRKSNILHRLVEFAEGAEDVEMSAAQVTAATTLLRKVLPDLQAVTVSGDDEKPPITIIERVIIDSSADTDG